MTQLEKAVEEVLTKDGVTPAEKIKAIEAGAKLLQIKHKIGTGGEEKGYFDEQ
ncbi:MAG TPA: hypothetical protein VGF90_04210 [Verrucomicrobiae bacterium]